MTSVNGEIWHLQSNDPRIYRSEDQHPRHSCTMPSLRPYYVVAEQVEESIAIVAVADRANG
jgi:hypothetical protein